MSWESMLRFMLHGAIRLALTALIILAAPWPAWCDPIALNVPKDAELITLFRSHRDAFERLASMAVEDKGVVSYLSNDTLTADPLTDGRNVLSQTRRSEYVRLLSSIRPDLVIRIDVDTISFSYSAGGTGLSIGRSWMKGIAYLPYGHEKVGVTVSGLDNLPIEDGVYLVPIEPKWYVSFVQLD
jgi:hypothetical protein